VRAHGAGGGFEGYVFVVDDDHGGLCGDFSAVDFGGCWRTA
jgi:hypothetical protein